MPDLFSDQALRAAIDAELAAVPIPEGKRGVLVGYYTIRGTWRVTAVQRVWVGGRMEWSIGATLGKDAATGQISGGLKVLSTW